MRFKARKTIRLGPLRLNFTQAGFSSWSLRVWRWSWNSKRGHVVDTPGPGAVHFGQTAAQRARRADSR